MANQKREEGKEIMKIMMVHPHDIYHDLEPWTVRITYLAQELVRAGHEVQLIYHLFNPKQKLRDAVKKQDFPFRTIPFHRDPRRLFHNCYRMNRIAHWSDVVHFQKCSNYAAVPAAMAAYFQRKPLHYDWDDWEQAIFEKDNHNPIGSWVYFKQMEKHLLKVVNTVSVASKGLQELAGKWKFPGERTFFIPVGADMDVFSPNIDGNEVRRLYKIDKRIVLYQGQLSGSNYVHLFLEAVRRVLANRDDIQVVIVGGGDKLKHAKEVSAELSINDKVLFTNTVPHHMVPQFIAAADVVVATFENNSQVMCKSPLKVVEYMASGKAIVASRVGGVPDMIGDCGILTEPENVSELALGIEKLLDDDSLRIRLGKQARIRAKRKLSWQNSAQVLLQAFHCAIRHYHGLSS